MCGIAGILNWNVQDRVAERDIRRMLASIRHRGPDQFGIYLDGPVGLGSALVRIDPFGVTSVIQMGGLNGVALSPDETKLHVVQMGTWTLDAAGLPGQKGGPTPGGDGIAVDCAGNITNNATNSAYGGPDGKTLIMVGGGTNAKTAVMTVPGLP